MLKNILFTDVSLNPKIKLGMGAYLLLPEDILNVNPDSLHRFEIEKQIVLKKFEDTSSTKLEIETVLWALEEFKLIPGKANKPLLLYSDSQCVCGLLDRRQRLEETNFIGKSSGKLLNHSEQYKEFYKLQRELGFEVIKVAGHAPHETHDTVHRIFSFVDEYVRNKFKEKFFR
jgi:ribonuclease HI